VRGVRVIVAVMGRSRKYKRRLQRRDSGDRSFDITLSILLHPRVGILLQLSRPIESFSAFDMSFHTTAATRFDSFNVYQTPYKKIRDHEIAVTILVPKELTPGTHPVFVRWHGGGLVSNTLLTSQIITNTSYQTAGTAEYPNWLCAFFVPFFHRNNAIAIMPNYRPKLPATTSSKT
jgi:acetyl esterase/lipase